MNMEPALARALRLQWSTLYTGYGRLTQLTPNVQPQIIVIRVADCYQKNKTVQEGELAR